MVRAGLLLFLVACASDPAAQTHTVAFDLDSKLATGATYWDLPYPSDLRLAADGTVDFTGFPNRRNLPVVNDLLAGAKRRAGFPVMPIAYVKFTDAAPQLDLTQIAAGARILDIDAASPERGTTYPVVAQTLATDDYTGKNLVALAPYPGIVLRAATRYAFVIDKTFAPGTDVPEQFAALADGSSANAKATALYAPLWPLVDKSTVLVATVFTTGDEVAVLAQRSEALRAAHHVTIEDLQVDPTDGAMHDGYCELVGTVTFPQFQLGTPPFDHDGTFAYDGSGVPIQQGSLVVPLHMTIPNGPMPATGWPLWQFFHGSGGSSADLVDNGANLTADSEPLVGEGPGAVVARRGIAGVSTAMPLNPERLPGASEFAYLNFNNLSAFPFTFQQGVFEQRMLLDALVDLQIPAATVAACSGVAATTHHFDAQKLVAGGHSMGGMYTNMIAAIEPRYGAVTPFGAGGFWNLMILETAIVPGAHDLLSTILGVDSATIAFTHPALGLLEQGWEIADPINSMARLIRRPLPGTTARHVYEPVGMDDKFFPNDVYDATALAYGNRQAGELVWPTTQTSLAVDHLDGMMTYPVVANRASTTTAVVVQYAGDGIVDSHQIFRQLDAVKYQYGCFLQTFLRDGVPTVAAPAPLASACP
jgi:predicted esterase